MFFSKQSYNIDIKTPLKELLISPFLFLFSLAS